MHLASWFALVLAEVFVFSRRFEFLQSQARLTTPRMTRRALEMDCCRGTAPAVVGATVVAEGAAVVFVLVVRVLFVLDEATARLIAAVLSCGVGVPRTPEAALYCPVWTDIANVEEVVLAVASGTVTWSEHWTVFPLTLACTLLAGHVEVNWLNWLFERVAQMNVASVLLTLAQQ